MSLACTSCGARLADDATVCDLCGTPVPGAAQEIPTEAVAAAGTTAAAATDKKVEGAGKVIFCNECGSSNPTGSRFCSQCGKPLQVAGGASARSAETGPRSAAADVADAKTADRLPPEHDVAAAPAGETAAIGKRLGMIVGAAVLVVVAFFLINTMRGGGDSVSAPPSGGSFAGTQVVSDTPLPAEVAERIETIKAEANSLEGEARLERLRTVVDELANVGRFDRAGAEMEAIATESGTEADWTRTGNLYYDWMDVHGGQERATFAQRSIAAYQKALELNPDNLDVRTDMAVAYMSDPENPMMAMQENAYVLERDSLHIQANFNRGIMLLQISRVDQAISQFEKVQRIINDPENPMYRLAEQALISVRQDMGATSMPGN